MASPELSVSTVRDALAEILDPETGRSVVKMEQVQDVTVAGQQIAVRLGLTSHSAPLKDDVRREVQDALKSRWPQADVRLEIVAHDRPPEKIGQLGLQAKSVVAVGSGKGGVGKSTIAASIAYGLHKAGCQVGLMDADVYGPSIPHLLGLSARAEPENGRIRPVDADGIKVMSMGFFVPPGEAVVWRGPMLHGAITQFLRDTNWGPLDYLIIDMPPGTGDIALTLSQLLPLTGAVVVCTPQDVALLDAVKAIAMFRKVNIPILGMVENMSYFLCPDNGQRYDIFGSGGARKKAGELDIPFLGDVPIHMQVRINGDSGQLAGNFDPNEAGPFFETICRNLARNIADSARAQPPMPSLAVL